MSDSGISGAFVEFKDGTEIALEKSHYRLARRLIRALKPVKAKSDHQFSQPDVVLEYLSGGGINRIVIVEMEAGLHFSIGKSKSVGGSHAEYLQVIEEIKSLASENGPN